MNANQLLATGRLWRDTIGILRFDCPACPTTLHVPEAFHLRTEYLQHHANTTSHQTWATLNTWLEHTTQPQQPNPEH